MGAHSRAANIVVGGGGLPQNSPAAGGWQGQAVPELPPAPAAGEAAQAAWRAGATEFVAAPARCELAAEPTNTAPDPGGKEWWEE